MRAHTHPKITPEVRRELIHSKSRDCQIPLEQQLDVALL